MFPSNCHSTYKSCKKKISKHFENKYQVPSTKAMHLVPLENFKTGWEITNDLTCKCGNAGGGGMLSEC